jgi:hypothetical protein
MSSTIRESDGAFSSSTSKPASGSGFENGVGQQSRLSLWLALLGMVSSFNWYPNAMGETVNLVWNLSPTPLTNVTGQRLYSATGNPPWPWGVVVSMPNTQTNATVQVSTNLEMVFTLTAYETKNGQTAESFQSNVYTNVPPPVPSPSPILTLVPPTMSTTNVTVGSSVNIGAVIRNDGAGDLMLVDGALTLLPPGGTRADGPHVDLVPITPQTLKGNTALGINGTWVALPTNGQWSAYIVVKDNQGTWTASTFTLFTVGTNAPPTAPLPPSGLRAVPVSTSRIDVSWDSQAWTVLIERSRDGRSFAQVGTRPGDGFLADTGLKRDTSYLYRTLSQNAAGTSGYSGTVRTRTLRR